MKDFDATCNTELVELIIGGFNGGEKKVIERALWFILHNQIVKHTESGHKFWVVEGSGMGSRCSGSIADYGFTKLVEQHLKPVLAEMNVKLYARYRDDIPVITETYHTAPKLTSWLQDKARRC